MPDIMMDTNAMAPPTESATEQPTSPVSNDQDELARLRAENASLKHALMQGQYIDSPAMFDLPAELRIKIYEFATSEPRVFEPLIAYSPDDEGQVSGIKFHQPRRPHPLKDAFYEARLFQTWQRLIDVLGLQ